MRSETGEVAGGDMDADWAVDGRVREWPTMQCGRRNYMDRKRITEDVLVEQDGERRREKRGWEAQKSSLGSGERRWPEWA